MKAGVPARPGRLATFLVVATIVAATLVLSRAFACATPFAAVAAYGALRLPRRAAVALVIATWLGNQAIGFGLLHYPQTPSTYGWGLAIGLAALAALATARLVTTRVTGPASGLVGAGMAAFAAYEIVLRLAATVLTSGSAAFSAAVVGRLLLIDIVALGLLVAVDGVVCAALHARAARRTGPGHTALTRA